MNRQIKVVPHVSYKLKLYKSRGFTQLSITVNASYNKELFGCGYETNILPLVSRNTKSAAVLQYSAIPYRWACLTAVFPFGNIV